LESNPSFRLISRWTFLVARVRVLIGHACRALGDDEAAGLEHQAASTVFERLGAQPDVARLDAPATPVKPASRNRARSTVTSPIS